MKLQKKCGWVAVIGRPNAGKSTLINALLGEDLSLVSPKAQTTRERVLGILSDPARGQAIFVDTPGVHRAREGGINAFMVGEARAAIEGVDLVLYLVDPASAPEHEEPAIALLRDFKRLANPGARVLLVWTKADLHQAPREWEAPHAAAVAAAVGAPPMAVVRVCPRGPGRGMKPLVENLWRALPEGPAEFPDATQVSDRPTRFFVAERVRGAIFRELGEELPYSCAVEIESYDEESKPPRIHAKIHVERESQKGIVIGAGGKKIKAIGTRARGEIEKFLGGPVFLGLTVGVLPDWTRDREKLKRLGFQLPEGS